MDISRIGRALAGAALLVVGLAPAASAAEPEAAMRDVTSTQRGRQIATAAAARYTKLGARTDASTVTVWELAPDEYVVGTSKPVNLSIGTTTSADGITHHEMSYDVEARSIDRPSKPLPRRLRTTTASWAWVAQGCFTRMGSASFGYLDSCYLIHQLVGETDPRTFFQLEHFGTLGAGTFTKTYNGHVKAVQAPNGAAMSWIDWSPRGNITGSCHNVNVTVTVLGVYIASPNLFCENNIATKSATAGSFKMSWDCGCIFPFGQPHPNTREIDYMQAVSVANGVARWTLSAGYAAR